MLFQKPYKSDVPGEKYNDKKRNYFLGFLKIQFTSNSRREEITFYEFYMIPNEAVKMYMPYYKNPTNTLINP